MPSKHQQRVDGIKEDGSKVSLIITAFLLPNVEFDNSNRIIIVFDDVSVLLEAQKSQAWADMARGLAHEIKNPLTPIILSAERLNKRLSGKLSSEEEVVLEKATRMIINQAVSLKTMVNEFQQYARLPKARPAQMDLDDVLREFLQMYSGDKRIKYERENGDTLLFNFDKDQMLQVLHNLLQNAQDAINNNPRGLIKIKTLSVKIEDQQKIQLSIEDNGPGIDQEILSRVFDPYTTTKAKGTGLGLPIVKKIIQENKATIILNNKNPNNGVVVHLLFDRITEKV